MVVKSTPDSVQTLSSFIHQRFRRHSDRAWLPSLGGLWQSRAPYWDVEDHVTRGKKTCYAGILSCVGDFFSSQHSKKSGPARTERTGAVAMSRWRSLLPALSTAGIHGWGC